MSEAGAYPGVGENGDWTRHESIVLSSGYGTRGLNLHGKTILVTGGTGSFGTKLIEVLLERQEPGTIRVYSRDELKQSELRRRFADDDDRMRYLIGDVRDLARLTRATRGVDVIVHAAALKQVPACEYNPFEAVQTNVVGAENVVAAAIENDVPLTMALSSDKAVNPVNLYGATKLCAEKIVAQGNAYSGDSVARFASVRYGNVVGSRGSVIPLFKAQAPTGVLTITDERMTRFWITLEQAVDFVLNSLGRMGGGEIFVPRIPSMRVLDIAEALAPDAEHRIIGIRPGEKLHEVLLTEDEARHTLETENGFVIHPEHYTWSLREVEGGRSLPAGFHYSSDQNDHWLDVDQLREMASDVRAAL
jgi:UDP-N-acetylglucosamine 4,6-dehydratase